VEKNALHFISYGMYVVSSRRNDGTFNAQIANSIMQVTNDPVALAISINKKNLTSEFIDESSLFGVSVLEKSAPLKLIGKFGFRSGRAENKFKDTEHKVLTSGCPVVLDNSLCYLGAKVVNKMDCGTYTVFLGEVTESAVLKQGEPMTYEYYHVQKCGVTPKSAPTYISSENQVKVCPPSAPKYRCTVCNYIYNPVLGDPDGGIAPGTPFESIPDTWVCPICGVSKDKFVKVEE